MNFQAFQRLNAYPKHFHRILTLILFFAIVIFISSCQEHLAKPISENTHEGRIMNRSRISNDTLDYFAKAVAKAQHDVDVRNFIKTSAANNQWGDNCLVYGEKMNVVVKNSQSLATILYNNRDQSDNRFGANFFTNDVFIKFPNISIYVYTGDDDYDISDFNTSTSKGVFEIPQDPDLIDSLIVYKIDPSQFTPTLMTVNIAATTEPTQQYFAVGPNSTLLAIDTDSFNLFPGGLPLERRMGIKYGPEYCEQLYEAIENNSPVTLNIQIGFYSFTVVLTSPEEILEEWCEGCDDTNSLLCSGEGGGEPCERECDRDCRENREQLVKYRFNSQNDLDRTCHWTRRWCAFNILAVHAINPGNPSIASLTKYDKARRKDLKGWNGNWRIPSQPVEFFFWDLNTFAEDVKYSWIYLHPQAGKEISHTVSLSSKFLIPIEVNVGGSFTEKITIKDIPCGEDLVNHCDYADNEGTVYYTGKVDFYIKERE